MKPVAIFLAFFLLPACYQSAEPGGDGGARDAGRDEEPQRDMIQGDTPVDPGVDPTADHRIDPDGPEAEAPPSCPIGLVQCGGLCVDLRFDPNNCGGCGRSCPPGTSCANGECVGCACSGGLACCQDQCVDLQRDRANCGGCGNVCPDGLFCEGGFCRMENPCDWVVCPDGLSCCYGECVDLTDDSRHCGYCGNVCPWGTGDPDRDRAVCVDPSAYGYFNLCCRGVCLTVDARRCGQCRSPCEPPGVCNGLWDEAAGQCEFMCLEPL